MRATHFCPDRRFRGILLAAIGKTGWPQLSPNVSGEASLPAAQRRHSSSLVASAPGS